MLRELLKRRVLMMLGKGGVGRTSVAAALGLAAARAGARVCVIEYDSRAPLAALFGREPSYPPIEAAPGLFLIALDGPRALAEYLGYALPSAMLRAVLSSRLYNYFVPAAPGLRELIMIGKLYHEIERRPVGQPPWDLVIFDAPASGQALDLLRMPLTARETFGASVVGREAQNVAAFLGDHRRCAAVQIANPDALTLSETLEFNRALDAIGMKPVAIVLNRAVSPPFGPAVVERMARELARSNGGREAPLVRRARSMLAAAARVDQTRRALQAAAGPVIALGEHPDAVGYDLAERLAAEIAELMLPGESRTIATTRG